MSNPRRTLSTHRVSYEMHHGKIKKGKRCLHTCDNPACVNPKHLWLGTQIDNVRDMTKKGRRVDHLGSKHGMAKLNESDVLKIRETHANNIVSYKSIARNYGVTPETISNVVRRKNWTHI